jgi:hypothetical protein
MSHIAKGIEKIRRAKNVGLPRKQRLGVRPSDERLCGHVKDHVGPRLRNTALQYIGIANVRDAVIDLVLQLQLIEQTGRRVGLQRISENAGAQDR